MSKKDVAGARLSKRQLARLAAANKRAVEAMAAYEKVMLRYKLMPSDLSNIAKLKNRMATMLRNQIMHYRVVSVGGRSAAAAERTVLKAAAKQGLTSTERILLRQAIRRFESALQELMGAMYNAGVTPQDKYIRWPIESIRKWLRALKKLK